MQRRMAYFHLRDWLPICLRERKHHLPDDRIYGSGACVGHTDRASAFGQDWIIFPTRRRRSYSSHKRTPLILQLYYLFYVLPLIGIRLNPVPTALIGLGSAMAASSARSIAPGSSDPHLAVGGGGGVGSSPVDHALSHHLSPGVSHRDPANRNYFIALFKDTALVSTIFRSRAHVQRQAHRFVKFDISRSSRCRNYLPEICYPSALACDGWNGRWRG